MLHPSPAANQGVSKEAWKKKISCDTALIQVQHTPFLPYREGAQLGLFVSHAVTEVWVQYKWQMVCVIGYIVV